MKQSNSEAQAGAEGEKGKGKRKGKAGWGWRWRRGVLNLLHFSPPHKNSPLDRGDSTNTPKTPLQRNAGGPPTEWIRFKLRGSSLFQIQFKRSQWWANLASEWGKKKFFIFDFCQYWYLIFEKFTFSPASLLSILVHQSPRSHHQPQQFIEIKPTFPPANHRPAAISRAPVAQTMTWWLILALLVAPPPGRRKIVPKTNMCAQLTVQSKPRCFH